MAAGWTANPLKITFVHGVRQYPAVRAPQKLYIPLF
jgi:hypothetical protein